MRFKKKQEAQPTDEDLRALKSNPFTGGDFKINTIKRSDPNKYERDDEGDWLPHIYAQEKDNCTKLYVSSEIRKIVCFLGESGAAVLLWVMYELKAGKDFIIINPKRFKKEHQYKTDKPLRSGLFELLRYQFIASTVFENVYYINPSVLFNGSRLKKYKQHAKSEGGAPRAAEETKGRHEEEETSEE